MSNPPASASREAAALSVLRRIVADLPGNRDWLDPDVEYAARAILNAPPAPGAGGEARRVVDDQAEDEGLWGEAITAMEAYQQAALRELHAAVERDTGGETGPRAVPPAPAGVSDDGVAMAPTGRGTCLQCKTEYQCVLGYNVEPVPVGTIVHFHAIPPCPQCGSNMLGSYRETLVAQPAPAAPGVSNDFVVRKAVEAAWRVIWLDDPPVRDRTPSEKENPMLWLQVRAIVAALAHPGAARTSGGTT